MDCAAGKKAIPTEFAIPNTVNARADGASPMQAYEMAPIATEILAKPRSKAGEWISFFFVGTSRGVSNEPAEKVGL